MKSSVLTFASVWHPSLIQWRWESGSTKTKSIVSISFCYPSPIQQNVKLMAGRESAEYQLWWESHCNGNSWSKQTINQQWESCPKQQNRFQTDLSSTFWNLRRHRFQLFVAISCVRQSFRLRARIQVRLSWSRISRLLQLRCTTKKLDLKALLNQSYKETFKWEFGKSLVGHREHSLLHKFKTTLWKRCNHKICRGVHENDSSKCSCDTPFF